MKNFFRNTVFPFVTSSAIFCGVSYAYVYYQTSKNYAEYLSTLQAGTLQDASRLSNDSFGISWGFQADDIVMKQIDSGDYLFMKYDCKQCLTPKSYIKCFFDSLLRLEEQFDSVGYAYRNEQDLFVIFNEFGVTRIVPYSELVGLPFIKELMVQKNEVKTLSLHLKLKKIVETGQKQASSQQIEESSLDLVNRMNKELFGDSYRPVYNLKQLLQTQKQIYVRTETNRTLRSL